VSPQSALICAYLFFACVLLLQPLVATAAQPAPRVAVTIEGRGTLVIELSPREAPKTVAHFLALVNKHFYDGILFHRVEPHFVAQAGDPASKKVNPTDIANIPSEDVARRYGLGGGGSGATVPLEAKLPHNRGTIGLARSQDRDSGDSQFFINLQHNHRLDGDYCVFGKIVRGEELIDNIHQGDRIKSMRVVTAAHTSPGKSAHGSGPSH
jgi:cyclophilin family peptidyl-prolyl cis-trans isomerase